MTYGTPVSLATINSNIEKKTSEDVFLLNSESFDTFFQFCGLSGLARVTHAFRHITKTYLYNFDPLQPHFYIVKLGFTGVCIIFLFCSKTYIVGTR